MSFLGYLKERAEHLPPWVGGLTSRIPFSIRLGPSYLTQGRRIINFESLSPAQAEADVLDRLNYVTEQASRHVPFYRELYERHGVLPGRISSLADFRRLPVVTKSDFQERPVSDRVYENGLAINTGGTSGQPLIFRVERRAFAREWAHMHHLWYARGYRKEHLKLTFRGKHFERDRPLKYNAVHNELIVNADLPLAEAVHAVHAWRGAPIRWVHGYPSLVSEFAKAIASSPGYELERFRARLFGVLLGSEYPAPHYRKPIAENLSVNILSWYGHSEMAVLAGELAEGLYRALPTYGYTEAVEIENSGRYRLVVTSFDNLAHPFIRYDTGDIIAPVSDTAKGLTFRILEGRIGDFILDRNGNRHSLTAVIFGRHHAAFADIRHVQVSQDRPGLATLLVTPATSMVAPEFLRQAFDLSGLDMDWELRLLSEPVRSKAGKIKLKIDPGSE